MHVEPPAEGVEAQPAAVVEVVERSEAGDGELGLADCIVASPPEAESAALPVDVTGGFIAQASAIRHGRAGILLAILDNLRAATGPYRFGIAVGYLRRERFIK